MAPKFSTLSNLTIERDDWIIQARLIRKCESLNLKADNELISLDMELLDANVSEIKKKKTYKQNIFFQL